MATNYELQSWNNENLYCTESVYYALFKCKFVRQNSENLSDRACIVTSYRVYVCSKQVEFKYYSHTVDCETVNLSITTCHACHPTTPQLCSFVLYSCSLHLFRFCKHMHDKCVRWMCVHYTRTGKRRVSMGSGQMMVHYISKEKTTELNIIQLTRTTGSGTDSSAGPPQYGWIVLSWVSFGFGTRSTSTHIRGDQTC